MIVTQQELFAVLRQYNPWWEKRPISGLASWRRAAFRELHQWLVNPPAHRAILLSGARQVGKTTLLLQLVDALLSVGTPPGRILYATFDHPLLKLIGLEKVMELWREMQTDADGSEFLLLDEIQYTTGWQTWLKHQVDFVKNRRIVVTGSAIPLNRDSPESGVGRWHTIKLATLSFYEYLQIKKVEIPEIPKLSSLAELFDWTPIQRTRAAARAEPLVAHFNEYLLRGGFPQTALVEDIVVAQKLLREDIVDKVLKRDMTALYGVRRILELEKTFLYLCLHDGGILDVPSLCNSLGVQKPTAVNYIDLLEAAHLIYRLPPFGYGKEILRARYKVYLADAAIAGSVLLKGASLLEDPTRLGTAVETAFVKHVFTRYYQTSIGFSYWRGKQDQEVDVIAELGGDIVPFEVKHLSAKVQNSDLRGLRHLCESRHVARAYAITRRLDDFEVLTFTPGGKKGEAPPSLPMVLKIPATLACYWLSRSELR